MNRNNYGKFYIFELGKSVSICPIDEPESKNEEATRVSPRQESKGQKIIILLIAASKYVQSAIYMLTITCHTSKMHVYNVANLIY